jgi:hypothetical protein
MFILASNRWLAYRRLRLHVLTLLALGWLAPGVEVASGAPVTETFNTPGSHQWTVPAGITSVTVNA